MTENVRRAVDTLRYCEESGARCGECPSGKDENGIPNCHSMAAIADLIERLWQSLVYTVRERDAAIRDLEIHKFCHLCAKDPINSGICRLCSCKSDWEWRGLCAENGGGADGT